jgi:predicted nucleotidyltransferase
MSSFLDRQYDREHDLGDISHILDRFIGPDDDRRWHDPTIHAELDFDLVSPFAVGLALAKCAEERHRVVARRFVAAAQNPSSHVHARLRALAPIGWRDGSSIEARLQAFVSGLG